MKKAVLLRAGRPDSFRSCGEEGIRTPGTVAGTHDFQSCTFDHSVTSPKTWPAVRVRPWRGALARPSRRKLASFEGYLPHARRAFAMAGSATSARTVLGGDMSGGGAEDAVGEGQAAATGASFACGRCGGGGPSSAMTRSC